MSDLRLLVFLAAVLTASLALQGYDVDSVLKKIPESEKNAFLKHHITLGYELSKIDISRNKKIPQDLSELPAAFSIALYEKFRENNLSPKSSNCERQARENCVCFENGQCIDLDDPGVHP